MKIFKIITLAVLLTCSSCEFPTKSKESNGVTNSAIKLKPNDSLVNCEQLMCDLLLSSNLRSDNLELIRQHQVKIRLSDFDDKTEDSNVILVQLLLDQDQDPAYPFANLLLLPNSKIIKDITNDIDSPILLTFDYSLFSKYVGHCLK